MRVAPGGNTVGHSGHFIGGSFQCTTNKVMAPYKAIFNCFYLIQHCIMISLELYHLFGLERPKWEGKKGK